MIERFLGSSVDAGVGALSARELGGEGPRHAGLLAFAVRRA